MKKARPKIEKDYPLASLTTLRVGGNAALFTQIKNLVDLPALSKYLSNNRLPFFIIGGGSNLLINDQTYPGLVIKNETKGIKIKKETKETLLLEVASGERLDGLVRLAVSHGWQGLECLSGIPGTIGGAVVQNANAYGQTIGDIVYQVYVFDLVNHVYRTFTRRQCCFGYRSSFFKTHPEQYILSVVVKLAKDKKPLIDHDTLKNRLKGQMESLLTVRRIVLQLRKERSTLYDLRDPNSISAGSFFINPTVSKEVYNRLKKQCGQNVPHWPEENGKIKLSAGWLIEKAGFSKGYIYKNTGLSTKHALVIINRGKASAIEIKEFGDLIADKVTIKFNLYLQPEVVMIGF